MKRNSFIENELVKAGWDGVTMDTNKPISFDGAVSCDVTLSKGNMWVIEATIDAAKLDGFNTFYATAVAADENSVTRKTGSILLYQED